MNSLQELNAFGRTKIVFEDDRPYQVELVNDDSGTVSRSFNEDIQTVLNSALDPVEYAFDFRSLDSETANHATLEIDLSNNENMNLLSNSYSVVFPPAPGNVEYVRWQKQLVGLPVLNYEAATGTPTYRPNVWAATKIQTENDLLNIYNELSIALIDRTDPITVTARIIYPPAGNQPVDITVSGTTIGTPGDEIIGDKAFYFNGVHDYLEADRPLLNSNSDFTVEFYVRGAVFGDTGTQSRGLLGQGSETGTRLVQNPNGSLEFFLNDTESVSTEKPYSGDASSFIAWTASVTQGSTTITVTDLAGANITSGEALVRAGDLIRVNNDREYVVVSDVIYPSLDVTVERAVEDATGSYSIEPGVGAIPNLVWTHCAVVRNSNNLTMYVDGRSRGSITVSGTASQSTNTVIGSVDSSTPGPDPSQTGYPYPFQGLMLEIRISDTARYTENFTPHSTAHEPDVNAVLLLHPAVPTNAPYVSSSYFVHDYPVTVIEKQYNISLTGSPEVDNLNITRTYNYGQTQLLFPDQTPEIVDAAADQRYSFSLGTEFGVNLNAPGNSTGSFVQIVEATRAEVEAWLQQVTVVSPGTESGGDTVSWSLKNATSGFDDYTTASGSFNLQVIF